jgi:ABC-type nickel/cobalt efflux system permease component RcnA
VRVVAGKAIGRLGVILLVGMFLALVAPAHADPLRGDGAAHESSQDREAAAPSLFQEVQRIWLTFQRDVNREITAQMVALKEGRSFGALFLGMLIAFLYGVAHALGPGHGKAVVVSYFLSREAGWRRGIAMGSQIALSHVAAAIVIVLLAHFALTRISSTPLEQVTALKVLSYGTIVAVGLYMLADATRRRLRRTGGAHAHACHHHGRPHGRTGGFLSVAVGLIPCSGAVLILLYALSNGLVFSGILMALSIAAGMAITLSAMGLATLYARRRTVAVVGGEGHRRYGLVLAVFEFLGPLLIVVFGAVLLSGVTSVFL